MIVPLCEFEGFYEPECCADIRFAWTRPVATVICHFLEPVAVRHIWLMVASAAPGGSQLSVIVQDGPCITLPRVLRNRIIRVPLGRKVKRSTFQIRLECQTFVPNDRLNNGDCRELGIALRRVILGRNWIACLRGLQVDPQPDASLLPDRVDESRAA